ncbi:MAG: aminoacyl-histidine dipeptidase [Bacteroidales bacterium]|nr:aminoacyl-histidine dipeptidase [Candidatus Colicola faecequi]
MEAKAVFDIFAEINKVPRPSKHEEKICEWLIRFAEEHKLEYEYMPLEEGATTGNILMRKPATPGYENHPAVVLQAHMDMVCEKNADCPINFETDPIETYIEDGWMHAKGTTLGADDGIGMAMALAILTDDKAAHPAVEALFTTDEETGLTGAFALRPGVIKAKTLINLDSEDHGQVFIGCAGGIDTLAHLYYTEEAAPAGYFAAEVKVNGLMGGHSGDDINKGRGNANKLLTRILFRWMKETDLRIAKIDGGNLRNAIAREAQATVLVPMAYKEQLRVAFNIVTAEMEQEFGEVEKEIHFELNSADAPATVLPKEIGDKLILALYACPHGMVKMSSAIPGLTQTSTNLASVKMKKDEKGKFIEINTSQRSSVDSEKHAIKDVVEAALALSGAEVTHGDGYPGWTPNVNSPLLEATKKAYVRLFGEEPKVLAIHAGLECGLFLEKYPGLDMVSVGPQMVGVHSPLEKLSIESTEQTFAWLKETLRML